MIDPILLKKLYYQSTHRGCKESDIIFTKFANKYLYDLSVLELELYIDFLSQDDVDIMQWMTLQKPFPSQFNLLKEKLFAAVEI